MDLKTETGSRTRIPVPYRDDPVTPPGWQDSCLLCDPVCIVSEGLVERGTFTDAAFDQDAAAVGCARSTVQLWFDAYRKGGVEALLKDGRADNSGRPDTFSPEVRQALEEGLKEGRWRTVPQMHTDLLRTFGITLKLCSLYNRLGKAGVRLRVPRPRHTLPKPCRSRRLR